MRKLALTAAVAAATLVSAPAADAHPVYHYEGGCYVTASTTETSNSPTWAFAFDIAVVATDANPTAPVPVPLDTTVRCGLWIDGVWQGYVAEGSSTVGVVVDHSTVQLEVDYDADVDVCTNVVLHIENSSHTDCGPVTMVHPDKTVCDVLPGDDVTLGDKIVYDCPAYGG